MCLVMILWMKIMIMLIKKYRNVSSGYFLGVIFKIFVEMFV